MESPKVHQFVFCVDNSMLSNSQSETFSNRILANLPHCFHRVESLNNIFFGKLFCFRHNVERDIRSAISKAITSLGVEVPIRYTILFDDSVQNSNVVD